MNSMIIRLALLSVLFATVASAATLYTLTSTITTEVGVSPIIFTAGSDTASLSSYSIGANGTIFTATVPLGVASNITVQEAVNLTNTDGSNPHIITGITVISEDFTSSLNQFSIYCNNGTRTLLLSVDTSGDTVYEFSASLSMPASAEWAIIVEGCYDDGTASDESNVISFTIEQE